MRQLLVNSKRVRYLIYRWALALTAAWYASNAMAEDGIYVTSAGPVGFVEEFDSTGNGSIFANSGMNVPRGIALDTSGNVFVANYGNNTIEKFDPRGVDTLFGSTGLGGPVGLVFDGSGNLYATNNNNRIERFAPNGTASTFVKNTGLSASGGAAFGPDGNLYVTNYNGSTIAKVSATGAVSTFVSAGVQNPIGLAFDKSGNLFESNFTANTIMKFTPQGVGSLFASTGLSSPEGLAFDSSGNLYVANHGNSTIEKFNQAGVGSTFATSVLGAQFIAIAPVVRTVITTNPVPTPFAGLPQASGSLFVLKNGAFVSASTVPGTAGYVDPNKPTVVLTHGYNDSDARWTNGSFAQGLDPGANIVAWDWHQDAAWSG